jgi:DNA-directed RNA polymerase subunit alpha
MPKRVLKDESTAAPTFGRYTAEPFEIGYARTIGNSLRRVLLSSIEGVAISAVRIQHAPHEFMAIPGVVEDVTDIILALKKVVLRSFTRSLPVIHIKRKGPCAVTAADLAQESNIEVLNPHHPIATVGPDGELDMEVFLSVGRGFCPAEWEEGAQQEIGIIPIDRIYSPVTRVNFTVGNTRVGHRTDYESLTLEITTDGRVTADTALTAAAAILRHQLDVFVEYDEGQEEVEEAAGGEDAKREELAYKLNMSVNEIELSVRAANCLNNANISTVGELVMKTEADMLKYRNFGKKSLNEIKDKLEELGMHLGFEFDPALLEHPPK